MGMKPQGLRGAFLGGVTLRHRQALAAFVEFGGSIERAAASLGIRPSTMKRHLADMRARSGLTTAQLIYRGRAEGWLVVPSLEPRLSGRRHARTPWSVSLVSTMPSR